MSALTLLTHGIEPKVVAVLYIKDDMGHTVDKVSVLQVGPSWLVVTEPNSVPDQYTQPWVFNDAFKAMNKALTQCGWGELAQSQG